MASPTSDNPETTPVDVGKSSSAVTDADVGGSLSKARWQQLRSTAASHGSSLTSLASSQASSSSAALDQEPVVRTEKAPDGKPHTALRIELPEGAAGAATDAAATVSAHEPAGAPAPEQQQRRQRHRRRRRRHRGPPYVRHPLVLEAMRASVSSASPFRQLASFDFLRVLPQRDSHGHPVLLLNAKNLPPSKVELETVILFLMYVLHEAALSTRQRYTLLYVHTSWFKTHQPGLFALLRAYQRLPRRALVLLQHLVVIHPTVGLWLALRTIVPFLHPRMGRKIHIVHRMKQLCSHGIMTREAVADVEWPDACFVHGGEREAVAPEGSANAIENL